MPNFSNEKLATIKSKTIKDKPCKNIKYICSTTHTSYNVNEYASEIQFSNKKPKISSDQLVTIRTLKLNSSWITLYGICNLCCGHYGIPIIIASITPSFTLHIYISSTWSLRRKCRGWDRHHVVTWRCRFHTLWHRESGIVDDSRGCASDHEHLSVIWWP